MTNQQLPNNDQMTNVQASFLVIGTWDLILPTKGGPCGS